MYRQGEEQTPWGQVKIPHISMDCSSDFDLSVKAARWEVHHHSFEQGNGWCRVHHRASSSLKGRNNGSSRPCMAVNRCAATSFNQKVPCIPGLWANTSAPACCACGYAMHLAVML